MSYASDKGSSAEREVADFLNKHLEIEVRRRGGAEKWKMTQFGDVIINPASGNSILEKYFLEVKKRESPQVFNALEEAERNAKNYGKWGAMVFAIKQKKSEKRTGQLVAMTWETFIKLIQELDGYRNQDETN